MRATATTMFGDRAKATRTAADVARQTCGEEADEAGDVAGEAAGGDARPVDEADELERLGDRRGDAAGPLVEAELLLVQQRRRGRRSRRARRRGTAATTRSAAASAPCGRCASSRRTTAPAPRCRRRRRCAPVALRSHRPRTGSCRRRAKHGEDHGRDDEDEERHAPAERVGEQAGGQRADERADGVRRAVRAVHPVARLDRVVVGEQRVVRRVDRPPCRSSCRCGRWSARRASSARPVRPENTAHTSAPPITSGTRGARSANWAIGTCSASAAIAGERRRARARSRGRGRRRRGSPAGGCRTPCGRARRRR